MQENDINELEEALEIFIEDQRQILEENFINKLPLEDQPLDDDIPDFFEKYSDEFSQYCRKEFNKEV